jgi:hypothetical protein
MSALLLHMLALTLLCWLVPSAGQTLQDRELEQLQASGGGDQLYQMVMQQRGQQEAAQVSST